MNSLRQMWLKWKMLKLPWRRQFLVGQDLNGNTYWEFRDNLRSDNRMRRIVKGRRNMPLGDIQAQISPMWHQWLRHTREPAPTMVEQQMDVARQIQLKHNARLADERWASKRRYIEKPKPREESRMQHQEETVAEMTGTKAEIGDVQRKKMEQRAGVKRDGLTEQQKPDPWEQERQKQREMASNPDGTWQPESWAPGPRKRG